MLQNTQQPILIAGVGIGGLTAALALHKQGFNVQVFERRENILERKGTALNIWSNAITALNRLGLGETVIHKGGPLNRSAVFSWKGELLMDTPVGKIAKEVGTPSVNIRRSELIKILYDACKEVSIPIHFGSNCVSYSQHQDGIKLFLDNGEITEGQILIGADGIRSTIRAQLLRDGEPTYLGYTIWRGISQGMVQLEPGDMKFYWGQKGLRGGCWVVDQNHVSWTLGLTSPPGGMDKPGEVKLHLLKLVADFPETLVGAIKLTPENEIFRIDAYARQNAEQWVNSRVALLGDAAHASPTVYGQGACQAIEDGIILAESIAKAPDPITGLQWYEARRKPRVNWLRAKIFKAAEAQNMSDPVMCRLRNMYVRHFLSKEDSLNTWRQILTFDCKGEV